MLYNLVTSRWTFFLWIKRWELILKTGIWATWISSLFVFCFARYGNTDTVHFDRRSIIFETSYNSLKDSLGGECADVSSLPVLRDKPIWQLFFWKCKHLGGQFACPFLQAVAVNARAAFQSCSYHFWVLLLSRIKSGINYRSAGSSGIQSEVFVCTLVSLKSRSEGWRQDVGYKPAHKLLWGKAVCEFTGCQLLGVEVPHEHICTRWPSHRIAQLCVKAAMCADGHSWNTRVQESALGLGLPPRVCLAPG